MKTISVLRNNWLMLPNQQLVSFQTTSKPECLDNQAVSLVSDFCVVYLRGCFIIFFVWVSVHENVLKHCLQFKKDPLLLFLTLEKKLCPYFYLLLSFNFFLKLIWSWLHRLYHLIESVIKKESPSWHFAVHFDSCDQPNYKFS